MPNAPYTAPVCFFVLEKRIYWDSGATHELPATEEDDSPSNHLESSDGRRERDARASTSIYRAYRPLADTTAEDREATIDLFLHNRFALFPLIN
jgi:hypothetical protein